MKSTPQGEIEDAVPHLEHRGPTGRRGHPRLRRRRRRGGARATKHHEHLRDADIDAKKSTSPTRLGAPCCHLQAIVTILESHAALELWSMPIWDLTARHDATLGTPRLWRPPLRGGAKEA
jgi:hypothetical protein